MKSKITISILIAIYLLSIISLASALAITSVSMNPDEIAPGESSTIRLIIKNNGETDLNDVSINLDFTNLPLAPFNSGSDFSFGEINSDKSKEAEFEIIALNDAKSGIYKIPIKISYAEDSQPKTKQSMISIMINSQPIIEASVEDGLLLKGQENKLTLKIINKGLADVKFLEIGTKSSTYYTLLSQNKVYVGDVDSNDFQTVDFNIFFNEKSPTIINLPVSIKYKDITNKEYSEDVTLNLKVYSKQQAQNLGLVAKSKVTYYVAGVIVLIVIYFVYRLVRRRNKSSEY